MNRITRTALTTVAATGLTLAIGSAAFANDTPPNPPVPSAPSAPSDNVGTTKARCDAAIDKRVGDLAAWTVKIESMARVSDSDKAALTAELASTSNDLLTVAKPAVDNAPDKVSLQAACKSIVLDYRVYRVVHPQVFLTATADAELEAISTLQAYSATLKDQGADTTAVDALLGQAAASVQQVPTNLASITPASYNSDPAATSAVIAADRAELKTVRAEIRQARTMLRKLAKSIPA